MEPTIHTKFEQEHFDSLQALRGIAALFVVSEHIPFLQRGAFGVDIFFVLSGMMAMHTTERNGMQGFFRKRLIRILPLYILATVGIFAAYYICPQGFEAGGFGGKQLLMSLCFIPFDIGGGVIQPILRIGWTLQYEMLFYLLFRLAGKINFRWRGVICAGFLMLLVILAAVLGGKCPFWLAFYGNPLMAEFLFGFLVYALLKRLHDIEIKRTVSVLAVIAALGVFAGLVLTKTQIYESGDMLLRTFAWGIAAAVLVAAFYLYGRNLIVPKLLIWVGNISYSIYLVHYFVVRTAGAVLFDFTRASVSSVCGVFAVYLLTIAVSFGSWYFIERRLDGWLRKKFLHG